MKCFKTLNTVPLGVYIFAGLFSIQSHAQIPNIERDALVALYKSTGGINWKNSANWKYSLWIRKFV